MPKDDAPKLPELKGETSPAFKKRRIEKLGGTKEMEEASYCLNGSLKESVKEKEDRYDS